MEYSVSLEGLINISHIVDNLRVEIVLNIILTTSVPTNDNEPGIISSEVYKKNPYKESFSLQLSSSKLGLRTSRHSPSCVLECLRMFPTFSVGKRQCKGIFSEMKGTSQIRGIFTV